MKRALLSWSGGKDCAWALERLRGASIEVAGLLTTVNKASGRVAMHAVRGELIEEQARSIGVHLWSVRLPWPCPNVRYEQIMSDVCRRAVSQGIEIMAFGDLFLKDIRAYRERMLSGTGLQPLFPLWELPTPGLAHEMIGAGLRAVVVCVDSKKLDRSFAGREFDARFLADLPPAADPCGENGEFHTFVYDGPMFQHPVAVEPGIVREESGFAFADLLCPVSSL